MLFAMLLTFANNYFRDGAHTTPMKIVQFLRLPPPVHLCPKFFHSHDDDLGSPISNEQTAPSPLPCMLSDKIKTKTKPSHVTFKLTTRSIVRFSPQTMQWYHLRMASLLDNRVINILMFDSA